ncbi:MAG: 2'-deoxycytidine 5'-triphosphate deaminase [Acidobacteria bacterium]|nr:2'-deoxycytidine 5'-triphosphate deaminase [Acidobacteriota bacterium]
MGEADDRATALFPELAREELPAVSTGVLPYQRIRALVRDGRITAAEPVADDQVQPASLDLRLGAVAYRLQASFLSGRHSTVARKLDALSMAELDLSSPTVLEKGCVYLAPLLESLRLPRGVSAKANPKSTTGRLDVFTRLITDYGSEFERVPDGYSGPLFAEIVPRTFSVIVQRGVRLSQLRFVRGKPPPTDSLLERLDEADNLVYLEDDGPAVADIQKGVRLSVSLRGRDAADVVGYRGRKNAPLVDLRRVGHYDPSAFWDEIRDLPDDRLILNPGDFYILGSRERVVVPPDCAAEMVPFDPTVGEFRIHYAGFFDPGFGYGDESDKGTRVVLEVRAHEVPFVIEHGQVVGRVVYSRLLEVPEKIYGASIGSSYQRQGLALSKQFRR